MKRLKILGVFALGAGLLAAPVLDDAWARAGGGRSFGSRGGRMSMPSRPYTSPYRPAVPPTQPYAGAPRTPFSGPAAGGGFWRGMAGGVVGGLLGGMLFRSLGFAGGGLGGLGGGFGLLDLLLLAGAAYVIYAFVRRRRAQHPVPAASAYRETWQEPYRQEPYGDGSYPPAGAYGGAPAEAAGPADVVSGLSAIRRTDPRFDEAAFREWCTDTFFRVQAAWMHRDLEALRPLLTPETVEVFRRDLEELRAKGQTNKLENISVRSVEVTEAWQEQGMDYVTVRYLANLLDYSVDDASGRTVAGSDREPVKFEEFWTWVRPVGGSPWRLSAIGQAG